MVLQIILQNSEYKTVFIIFSFICSAYKMYRMGDLAVLPDGKSQ